jgi:hypothetical protein
VEVRTEAAQVLYAALPDAFENVQAIIDILDTEVFSISLTKTQDIAAVCIFRIYEGKELEAGTESWGEIKWLGTRPGLQRQGFGKPC